MSRRRAADKREVLPDPKFGDPVVTQVSPLQKFYEAEDYHMRYYEKNSRNAYCTVVINPKLEKVQKEFGDILVRQK